jgi:hypothetical protein
MLTEKVQAPGFPSPGALDAGKMLSETDDTSSRPGLQVGHPADPWRHS